MPQAQTRDIYWSESLESPDILPGGSSFTRPCPCEDMCAPVSLEVLGVHRLPPLPPPPQ